MTSQLPETSSRPAMLVVTHLDVWTLTGAANMRGAGNQDMYNMLLGYAAAGYDVHVLTTSGGTASAGDIGRHIHVHRVPLPGYAVMSRLRGLFRGASAPRGTMPMVTPQSASKQSIQYWASFQLAAWRHGRRLAKQHRFDLVCGYEIYGAQIGYRLARKWNVPCVTRFQGTEHAGKISNPKAMWRDWWTWMRGYNVRADLVVMANDGTEGDVLLKFLGHDMGRVGFWMNGVDKDRVRRPDLDVAAFRRAAGIPDDHVFITTTVRLVNWKRHDRALDALAALRPRTDRFTYVIVGEGPMRAALQAQCTRLGLDDRVKFLGAMPHERVVEYVNACDIYLSVNDLSNLGNPLIEATLCGRCIVTLNNGATRDLITHDVNGLMLPPDDTAALAAALERLIREPAERARLAAGAIQNAQNLKTWSERMELEIETLHHLTKGRTLCPTAARPVMA